MQDYPLADRAIGRILADKAARISRKTFLSWQSRRFSYRDRAGIVLAR